MESLALGIDRFKLLIINILKNVLKKDNIIIRGVYERSDAKVRLNEGMERIKGFVEVLKCLTALHIQALLH